MKKIISVILACLMLTVIFTGCTANATPGDAGDENKTYTIGFTNMDDVYPYCIKLRDALVSYAEDEGMKVLVADGASDVNQQNSQVENFIAQGVDVVVAISIDLDGNVPAVQACKDAGIPYISLLTHVNADGYLYIGSENIDAGRAQGEYLAATLPEGAKVCYLTHRPNDQQTIDRKAGLVEKLFDVRADIELLSEQNCENLKDKGMSITEDWLQMYDDIDCIVAQNDDSALGAIEALKAADRLDEVVVVGLDASELAVESIKNGEMAMSVYQDAFAQAKAVVSACVELRDGKTIDQIDSVTIPFTAISIDNIDDAK